MDLVIGGAYQGKLDFAREKFALAEGDVFICTEENVPDFTIRCIANLERYILGCVRRQEEPELALRKDAVVICNDISCGVVPIEPDVRAWRESTGRVLSALSREADSVTRLFCGIPQQLK